MRKKEIKKEIKKESKRSKLDKIKRRTNKIGIHKLNHLHQKKVKKN